MSLRNGLPPPPPGFEEVEEREPTMDDGLPPPPPGFREANGLPPGYRFADEEEPKPEEPGLLSKLWSYVPSPGSMHDPSAPPARQVGPSRPPAPQLPTPLPRGQVSTFQPPRAKGPILGAAPSESVRAGVPLYAGHGENYAPAIEGQPDHTTGQAIQQIIALTNPDFGPEAAEIETELPTGSVRPGVPLYAGANQNPSTRSAGPQTLEEAVSRGLETPLPTGSVRPGVPLYGGGPRRPDRPQGWSPDQLVNQTPTTRPGGAAGIGAGVARGAAGLGDMLTSPEALALLVGIPAVSALLPARAAAILNAAASGKFGFDIAKGLSTERAAQLGDAVGSKDPQKIAGALTSVAGDFLMLVSPRKGADGWELGGLLPDTLRQATAAGKALGRPDVAPPPGTPLHDAMLEGGRVDTTGTPLDQVTADLAAAAPKLPPPPPGFEEVPEPDPARVQALADELKRQFEGENHARRGSLKERAALRAGPPTDEEFRQAAKELIADEQAAQPQRKPDILGVDEGNAEAREPAGAAASPDRTGNAAPGGPEVQGEPQPGGPEGFRREPEPLRAGPRGPLPTAGGTFPFASFRDLDALRDRDAAETQEGAERLRPRGVQEKPSLGQVAPGDPENSAEELPEDTQAIQRALKDAMPDLVSARVAMGKGDVHQVDVTGPIIEAEKLLQKMARDGTTLKQFLDPRYGELLPVRRSDETEGLLRFFEENKREPKEIVRFLRALATTAQTFETSKTESLFGDELKGEPPTQAEVYEIARRAYDEVRNDQTDLSSAGALAREDTGGPRTEGRPGGGGANAEYGEHPAERPVQEPRLEPGPAADGEPGGAERAAAASEPEAGIPPGTRRPAPVEDHVDLDGVHDFRAAPEESLSANPKPEEEAPEPTRRLVPKEPPRAAGFPKEPKIVAPPFADDKLARVAKVEMRATLGELAHRHDVESKALEAWDHYFEAPSRYEVKEGSELHGIAGEWERAGRKEDAKALREHAEQIDFIDRMERGTSQRSLAAGGLARHLKKAFDARKDTLIGLGMDAAKDWMENYFPHIWEKKGAEKGSSVISRMLGRRPLEGGKSFTKQRVFPTFMDGIRAGYVPAEWNPVRLSLLKLAEQDRCITAWKLLDTMHKLKLPTFVRAGSKVPEGYSIPNDNAFKVYKSPTIDVKEAFDPKLIAGLEEVGKELGTTVDTRMKLGRSSGAGTRWGSATDSGDTVLRRFGGPEEVLAHELGHVMNTKLKLLDRLREDAPEAVDKELRRLAQLRMEGHEKNASGAYRKYIQTPDERVANLIHAAVNIPDVVEEYAPETWKKLEKIAESEPAVRKLLDVQRSVIVEERTGKVSAGGIVQTGSWALPTPVTDVLNTHLTPSLLSGSRPFDMYRKASNALLMARLGWSGFHLGFTTNNAVLSKVSLAATNAARGDVAAGVKAIGGIPAALVSGFHDSPALKEWYAPGTQGEEIGAIVRALEMGGARVRQPRAYELGGWENFFRELRKAGIGNEGGARALAGDVLRSPGAAAGAIARHPLTTLKAAVEVGSRYILNTVVPRQKIAAAADLAERELLRFQKDLGTTSLKETLEQADPLRLKDAMARAWDSVDNRFGQVVYDNLFMNRTLRDALHATTQSVGWNLGTARELGGGVKDIAKGMFKAETDVRGVKLPRLNDRMAYTMLLPFYTAVLNSAIQYLYTGESPKEAKDLVFPRNGRLNPDGTPMRLSPATYMRDVAAFLGGFIGPTGGLERGVSQAATTVVHKMNPLLSMLAELLVKNEDFYGTEIRHKDDPVADQLLDVGRFLVKGATPYSVQGMMKQHAAGASWAETTPAWFGLPPASASLSRSPLMQSLIEYQREHRTMAPRTRQQAEKSDLRKEIRSAHLQRDDEKLHEAEQRAREGGFFTPRELRKLGRNAAAGSLVQGFKGLPLPDAIRIFKLGSPEEKAALTSTMRHKIANRSGLDAVPLRKRVDYLKEARSLLEAK